jgi:hypothetical protein
MLWVDATFLSYAGCSFVSLCSFDAMLPSARPIDKLDRSAQIQLGRMSLAAQYLFARFDNFRAFLWRAKMTVSGILLHVLNAVYPHSSVGDPFALAGHRRAPLL